MSRKRSSSPSPSPEGVENTYRLFSHSLALMGDSRWEEAAAAWQQFLLAEKDASAQAGGCQNLSICYLELECYEQALEALQRAEELGADLGTVAQQRGTVYACQGQASQAIAAYEKYSRLHSRQARQENVHKTLDLLRDVQKGKASPHAFLLDFLKQHIELSTDLQEFGEVERCARRMIELDPAQPQGHFALGVACNEAKNFSAALAAFEQARQLEPKHAITLYNLGHTLVELDRP